MQYHSISTRDLSRLHQYGKKLVLRIFLGYELIAGGIWKGNIQIADLEDLENLDASEIHLRRINSKEVLISQKGNEPDLNGTLSHPFLVGVGSALFPLWCACLLLGLGWCRSGGVGAPSEMPLMSLSSLICPGCRAFLRRLRAFWYTLACLKRKVFFFIFILSYVRVCPQ